MRTKKSMINMITSIFSQIIIILLGFISRRVLIYSVGVEYLGINGLMTNILTIFSLAESGIGTVIGFSLYEPLANNDKEKVKSLMYFYKWSYRILALFTAIVGICFFPFLPIFLKGNTAPDANLIYWLFLMSSVVSYFYSYKITLNNSDQNKYLYTLANTISQIFVLVIKVCILYFYENYILYLLIEIITNLIKNLIFSKIVDKKYSYIKEKHVQKLDKNSKHNLIVNIKALFIGKVGYIISQCSDNLVISSIVNITSVGLYSNYTTLINSVQSFISTFISSLTASMGNLIALENSEKTYAVYRQISFINYWLYTFSSACLLCLIEPFINIWLGNEFILNKGILFVSITIYYLKGLSSSVDMVKSAAGLFHPDRYVPILEALLNLVLSMFLANKIGLLGVLIGTLISFVFFQFWTKPYFVFTRIFEKKFTEYLKELFVQILYAILLFTFLFLICNGIKFNNIVFSFLVKCVVAFVISNLYLYLVLHADNRFDYIKNMFNQLLIHFNKKK